MEQLRIYWQSHRRILVIIAGAVVVVGAYLTSQIQQTGLKVADSTTDFGSTPSPSLDIVVDVEGAVKVPGVHTLPPGSVVDDAIAIAGGLSPEADLAKVAQQINRADQVKNHQKIYIAVIGQGVAAKNGNTEEKSADNSSDEGSIVNLNTATEKELDTLPGVGPATAQKIIDYREEHGQFTAPEELKEIPGIGDAKYEKLKDLITV